MLHATAEQEAENLKKLGLKQPIAIIPNGINFKDYDKTQNISKFNNNELLVKKKDYRRKLLYLSRIHPKKGLINLVKAWEKLKSNKILRVPGAYNPLTAKLIEEIGYDAVYVSGGVMANDLGFPDIGLTTLQDVSTRSYLISRVTNLPTIVDIDTGFKSCKETI